MTDHVNITNLCRRRTRPNGFAMLIVLVAVGVAVVLSAAFAARESTASVITNNIQAHTQARLIAESALELVIQQVSVSRDWRDVHTSGLWVDAQPCLGGLCTLYGEDGESVNGQFDGDGNLADSTTDPLTLTVTGTYAGAVHTVHATMHFTAAGSIYTDGLVAGNKFEMKNKAVVDSWNSTLGAYGGSNQGDQAVIITNAAKKKKVKLDHDTRVNGNVVIGPQGDPIKVVEAKGEAAITGHVTAASSPYILNEPTAPTDIESTKDKYDFKEGDEVTLSGNLHIATLQLKKDAIVRIEGHVRLVVDGSVQLHNESQIQLNNGATLEMYVGKKLSIKDDSLVNTDSANPSAFVVYMTNKKSKVDMNNDSIAYARIFGGTTKLELKNNAEFYGIFQGKEVKMKNDSKFHQDLASLEAGSGGPSFATRRVIWYESD